MSLLTRILRYTSSNLMVGDDVYGVKRTVCRALDANDHGRRLAALEADDAAAKRTFGPYFKQQVNDVRKQMGYKLTGVVDQSLWSSLARQGWPDARAIELMNNYIDAHPASSIVFPVPMGQMASVCQGLHETAGLDGNWAIDFCSPPGTSIVAVEKGAITKLSGKPPSQDSWDASGTYGWSVHFRTGSGYRYYVTHFGVRAAELRVGTLVEAGDTLGRVGDQVFRPDHIHYGVTSPVSSADARRRITAVSRAPRIH